MAKWGGAEKFSGDFKNIVMPFSRVDDFNVAFEITDFELKPFEEPKLSSLFHRNPCSEESGHSSLCPLSELFPGMTIEDDQERIVPNYDVTDIVKYEPTFVSRKGSLAIYSSLDFGDKIRSYARILMHLMKDSVRVERERMEKLLKESKKLYEDSIFGE